MRLTPYAVLACLLPLMVFSACQRDIPRPKGEVPPEIVMPPFTSPVATDEAGNPIPADKAGTQVGEVITSTEGISTTVPAEAGRESAASIDRTGMTKVVVATGDNLFRIALRYGTTVDQIQKDNGLDSITIYVGQTLYIKTGEPVKAAAEAEQANGVYTVKAGDNLFRIALKFGTSVEAIAAANGIDNAYNIYEGQQLKIPTVKTQNVIGGSYVVQTGDSLTMIALKFNTSVADLAAANGITNTNVVYVGQTLNIP